MDTHTEQLVAYIRQQLAAGVPANVIWQTLLQSRWQPDMVQRAFALIQAPEAPPPVPGAPQKSASLQESITSDKYQLFASIKDTLQSIRNNTNNFGLALIIGSAISIAFNQLVAYLIFKLFYADLDVLFATAAERTGMAIGSFALYAVWYAINVYAFTVLLLAVYDGSQQRAQTISALLKYGLTRMKRMVPGVMMLSFVTLWPIALLILLPVATLDSNSDSTSTLAIPLISIFSIIWLGLTYVRFALVPYVILFEPTTPVTKSFSRSKKLLQRNGGQWFLLKGMLLLVAIFVGLSLLLHVSLPEMFLEGTLKTNIALYVLSLIAECVLVLLYRNRAALDARNNQTTE